MPKDEFDFEDPLELNGVALHTDEDTQRDMAECFVEEFLMLGYDHNQLLALFRNPHYTGMNMVLQNKGEAFVKEVIHDVCACWGRQIEWSSPGHAQPEKMEASPAAALPAGGESPGPAESPATGPKQVDPLGNAVPELNL